MQCCELPNTLQIDCQPEDGEKCLDFRLIYDGQLPAEGGSGGKTKYKQLIRKELHKQLGELWKQHPDLRSQAETKYIVHKATSDFPAQAYPPFRRDDLMPDGSLPKTWLENIADDYARCGSRFVPLIRKSNGFTCSLDILFLRRDNPGNLIASGGDIDNRIKVLFDGLKMPTTVPELGGLPIEPDENPFFCLLEDDSLITKVTVTTDRLLIPQSENERIHDVRLIIHVTVNDPSALFIGNRLI